MCFQCFVLQYFNSLLSSACRLAQGAWHLSKSGTLWLEWDNRGAPWRQTRDLKYRVELLFPGHPDHPMSAKETKDENRSNLTKLLGLKATLRARESKLEFFNERCDETIRTYEAQIAELQAEVERMKQSRDTARELESKVCCVNSVSASCADL